MNAAKQAFKLRDMDEENPLRWLRLTLAIDGYEQKFLSEVAASAGMKTPAFVAKLIRDHLHEIRQAARGKRER